MRRGFGREHRPVRADVVLARWQPRVALRVASALESPCEAHLTLPELGDDLSPVCRSQAPGRVREIRAIRPRIGPRHPEPETADLVGVRGVGGLRGAP
jgi:hypothetical protein